MFLVKGRQRRHQTVITRKTPKEEREEYNVVSFRKRKKGKKSKRGTYGDATRSRPTPDESKPNPRLQQVAVVKDSSRDVDYDGMDDVVISGKGKSS
jgi:hypothetical protein